MPSPSGAIQLTLCGVALAAALSASAAFAQTGAEPSSAPVPAGAVPADMGASPGLPGPQSVDPSPGAGGAYAGHSEHAFYDVDDRIAGVQRKIASNLTGPQQKAAMSELASIKSEEQAQRARHGDLLDWARENLNHRIDKLLTTYPALAG